MKVLGASFVLVMGHESCGAVGAVLGGNTEYIEDVANLIEPAIKGTKSLEEAIKANVRWVVSEVKKSSFIQKQIKGKKLDCRGAYYHLGSGKVELL